MKHSMRLFAMAALTLAAVATTGCSKDDEQAESTGKVVVSTTTVSLTDGNKALNSQGEKTFSVGDEVAVVYENTSSTLVKATVTLAEADISNGGKTASITVGMTDPKSGGRVKIIYPAAMATAGGDVNYAALANQDGKLTTIARSLDLALYEGSLNGSELPASPALVNPLAVCEFQIKNTTGSTDLTPSVTMLYIADGTNSYYLSGLSGLSSIWVVMKPVESATLTFHAIAGSNRYEKEISGKTLAAGNMYHVAVGTTQLRQGALFGTFSVSDTRKVHFSQGNLKYNSGAWSFHTHQYECVGGTTQSISNTDLFYWGGSSKSYGATETYDATGDAVSDVVDWGNTMGSGWSTMTNTEWDYLFNNTSVRPAKCYAKAYLFDNTHGVILFPDNYTHPTDVAPLTGVNATGNTSWNDNTYTAEEWTKMEAAGAVFLPAAGRRQGSTVNYVGDYGFYWSSSPYPSDANSSYNVRFNSDNVEPARFTNRNRGFSVRLVCE